MRKQREPLCLWSVAPMNTNDIESEMVTVSFKIPQSLYDEAALILAEQGLTVEDALVMFFKETVRLGRIPFEYTEQDLEEARQMEAMLSDE